MRSLMRFFVQFTDAKKHEAIQTILNGEGIRGSRVSRLVEAPKGGFINVCLISFELPEQK